MKHPQFLQALLDGKKIQYEFCGDWKDLTEEGLLRRQLSGEVDTFPNKFRIVERKVMFRVMLPNGFYYDYPTKQGTECREDQIMLTFMGDKLVQSEVV